MVTHFLFFQLVSLATDDKTSVHFSSLPGQGVIYNVIVWDPFWNTSAAYVPVHTYACSLTALVDNCSSLSKSIRPVCFLYAVLLSELIDLFNMLGLGLLHLSAALETYLTYSKKLPALWHFKVRY